MFASSRVFALGFKNLICNVCSRVVLGIKHLISNVIKMSAVVFDFKNFIRNIL